MADRNKVMTAVDEWLEEDPRPTQETWGMSPTAVRNAELAEVIAGGPAPAKPRPAD